MQRSHLRSVLATERQLAADATVIRFLADPDVKVFLAEQHKRFSMAELAQLPAGAARLQHALETWTGGLVQRWLSGDPNAPAILLTTDNTPRSWFGMNVPATGAAGDNPDHVYRNSFIDGTGRYEIHGRFDPANRPVQFSVDVNRGLPGRLTFSAAASASKVRNQIDIIIDDRIVTDADGAFVLTLGGEGVDRPNHLELAPETVALVFRDVLSDWRQHPVALELRRIDQPAGAAMTYDELKNRMFADLPDYLDVWSKFPLTWLGGIATNSFKPPVPRDGGWGYMAGVRFDLQQDEVFLITMKQGRAKYLGIQTADPWFLAADARQHTASLNTSQAEPNGDGTYTYVVAAEDPGVANWLDTGGLRQGLVLPRWQAVPPAEPVKDFLLEARRMTRAELDRDYPGLKRLSAPARARQRLQHASEHALRFQH